MNMRMLALFILSVVFGSGGLVMLVVFWKTIGNMRRVPSPPPGFPHSRRGDGRA